ARSPGSKNGARCLAVQGPRGTYDGDAFLPYDQLPQSLDTPKHFYNSSNNDVVPKIVPGYTLPLGYEYSAPYRYDRVAEVLSQNRKCSIEDMEALQHDVVSLPARVLVPLLKNLTAPSGDTKHGVDMLLAWNLSLDRDSAAAALYEYWVLKMTPKAYAPRVPAGATF